MEVDDALSAVFRSQLAARPSKKKRKGRVSETDGVFIFSFLVVLVWWWEFVVGY